MAKRKHIQSRHIEISEAKKNTTFRIHFDYNNSKFAEEHYGKYLIVSNSQKDDPHHNRLYLCHKEYENFHIANKLTNKNNSYKITKAKYLLLDIFPNHNELILKFCKSIPSGMKRYTVRRYLLGFSKIIQFFQSNKIIIPKDPINFKLEHNKKLSEGILNGNFKSEDIRQIAVAWKYIKERIGNTNLSKLPTSASAQVQLENINEDEKNLLQEKAYISSEVLVQLDYYAQEELKYLMENRIEYLEWMKELDEINRKGGLFSQANLLKTIYSNLSWHNLKNYYIEQFNENPILWKSKKVRGYKKTIRVKTFSCKKNEKRYKELLTIAEKGINLSIKDEKMMAWWIATIMPNFPYDRKVSKKYTSIVSETNRSWLPKIQISSNTNYKIFLERIVVSKEVLYPLYLLMLIRYEINLDTLTKAEIYLKNEKYELGSSQYDARYIGTQTIKSRSNSVIPIVVQKNSIENKCIDFYLEWMTDIFKKSKLNKFFQYFDLSTNSFILLDSSKISNMRTTKNEQQFFRKYNIYETIEQKDNKIIKQRVHWIKHYLIRGAANYTRYLKRYSDYVRSRNLNHSGESTEIQHYRNKEFKWMMDHQLGLTQAVLLNHVTKIKRNKQLDRFFQTPLTDCTNPKLPDYHNAPKILSDEICTAWWHCLECN